MKLFASNLSQLEKGVDMSVIAEPTDRDCVGTLQEVAELYAAHAVRVRRLVHLRLAAPDALIEDACQVAWSRLVVRHTRVRREVADRWLVSVAVHEALRLIARGGREVSLQSLEADDPRLSQGLPDLVDALAEPHLRLEAIRDLPERQQRLLWLQGLGFSYEEMAGATGESRRTVERQLLRAQRALADVAS
jgi:RNA polymerase sigma factor (sigma-70 family)